MEAFTNLAQLYADGKAGERWIVDKVSEILARSGYANSVIALPLGQLYGLDDEWGPGGAAPTRNYAPSPAKHASTNYASPPPADLFSIDELRGSR